MKKFLLVLAIGAFVASCNDSGSTQETKATDSAAPATAPVDSLKTTPDSLAKPVDSLAKPVDTLKK